MSSTTLVEGKIEDKRGVERKQKSWLRNIREWTGLGNISKVSLKQNKTCDREIA